LPSAQTTVVDINVNSVQREELSTSWQLGNNNYFENAISGLCLTTMVAITVLYNYTERHYQKYICYV